MTQLGDGAGTGYPTAIDTRQVYSNVPSPLPDGSSRMDAEALNDVLAALIALETELGVLPKGTFASVAARLAAAQIPAFTLAGLPAPGTAGRLARVTDGGAVDSIVVENGSNWRSIYSRNTRILVVTDPQFGAVGDGSTNDRAAIQAALDALPSTGGVVLIPGGLTYNLGSGLTLTKSNVEIIAYGAILKATAATFNVITIGSDVSGALSNIAIRGATIHGAATDETSTSAMITNDSTSAHSRIVVSDCTISGPSGSTGFVRGIVFVDISDSLAVSSACR